MKTKKMFSLHLQKEAQDTPVLAGTDTGSRCSAASGAGALLNFWQQSCIA